MKKYIFLLGLLFCLKKSFSQIIIKDTVKVTIVYSDSAGIFPGLVRWKTGYEVRHNTIPVLYLDDKKKKFPQSVLILQIK